MRAARHRVLMPAAFLLMTVSAFAAGPNSNGMVALPNGTLIPGTTLVNPTTGQPYAAGGSAPLAMATTNPVIQGGATPATATVAANQSRRYLEIYNEGSNSCRFGYGANPGSTGGMPLPPGDFSLDGASTAQAIWFYCPQTSQLDITEGQ